MFWTDGNGNWTSNVETAKNVNYYNPSARELYDFIESQTDEHDSWDAVDDEMYIQLADCCGLDRGDYSNTQEFMDDCLLSIEKEEDK